MKTLDQETHQRAVDEWKAMHPAIRKQTIARIVFGIQVDPAFGMIVEEKEGGGGRILPVPEKYLNPSIEFLVERMKERGWVTATNAPAADRSTKRVARMTSESLGASVQSPPVTPEIEAVKFCAWLAHHMEQENVEKQAKG